MTYHVQEQRINLLEISSSITVCDKGIVRTFERAKEIVLEKIEEKQRALVQAKYHIEHDMKEDNVFYCEWEEHQSNFI